MPARYHGPPLKSASPMSNQLKQATSPYLLQHADHPVAWYQWGEEALQRARDQDLPILLSVGYSACHWCHVMAHESFEDDEVAQVMNQHFINIKVDREERPDLDRIYQLAHQMLTQQAGGWPLTVFLDPQDLTPFFAGTYFPKKPRYGMPGFISLLQRIAVVFNEQRDNIARQNGQLRRALNLLEESKPAEKAPALTDLTAAVPAFASRFDEHHGGLGGAPKFPRPGDLRFLLQQARRGSKAAEHMAQLTLVAMAEGGLYDHLSGGFYRYCVDEDWTIPHFEKMLYDNAQLLLLYAEAAFEYQHPRWRQVVRQTAHWARQRMLLPNQTFAASLDADSEGGEGACYVWTPAQINALLQGRQRELLIRAFGLDREANFEAKAWHLRRYETDENLAQEFDLPLQQVRKELSQAGATLVNERQRRAAPARDHKTLTAWNALMIQALARAGRLLQDHQLINDAVNTLDALLALVWREHKLFAVHALDQTHISALLEDHAYLLAAIMELLQSRFDPRWFDIAQQLADRLINHFQDHEAGGFFMTPDDHEPLISRPKPYTDDALPSGNAIAISALAQFGHISAQPVYVEAAESALNAGWDQALQNPIASCSLLHAANEVLEPPPRIMLSGPQEQQDAWRQQLVLPLDVTIYGVPRNAPECLASFAGQDTVTAYICYGGRCLPPIREIEHVITQLAEFNQYPREQENDGE